MMFIAVIFCALVGCMPNNTSYIEPSLAPYINDFYTQAEARGRHLRHLPIDVRYGLLEFHTLGVCYRGRYPENNLILVNAPKWDNMTQAAKRELIYHEMAHCVMNKPHVPDRQDDLMVPVAISSYDEERYLRLESYLLDKLFK